MRHGEREAKPGGNDGVTAITNLDSGTKISATKAAGFTADLHEGAICWVMDKAASAGAAPEGEMAGITSNTAAVLNFDPDFPLTVALAVNDDLEILYNYQMEDAAASDRTTVVQGVIAGTDGIPDKQFGWVQFFGMCRALLTSAAYDTNDILVAGTARLVEIAGGASDTGQGVLAKCLVTIKADSVSDFALVFINCGEHAFGNISTLDITA